MILEQVTAFLREKDERSWDDIRLEEVRMGPFLTAVSLSDGTAGLASNVSDKPGHCRKHQRNWGPFSPLQIRGRSIAELFHTPHSCGATAVLKMAVINALSTPWFSKAHCRLLEDTDPIELPGLLDEKKRVVMVGAFHSYIRKITQDGRHSLRVLELHEHALAQGHEKLFASPSMAAELIPPADVVIITGMSLVNNTLDSLLDMIHSEQTVILVGPSAGVVPQFMFDRHVDWIGTVRITDADRLLQLVGEGGSGYHLFHYCAKKICVGRKEGPLPA